MACTASAIEDERDGEEPALRPLFHLGLCEPSRLTVMSCDQQVIQEALVAFREDVTSGGFPSAAFSPYKISDAQRQELVQRLQDEGLMDAAAAVNMASRPVEPLS